MRNLAVSRTIMTPYAQPASFLYFAYGPNLLERYIHMYNPSAEFVTIGRLDNYRIDFINCSTFWGGPTITMVPTANAHIWGAIWKLHKHDMISLNDQKGVHVKKYYPKVMDIVTPHMGVLKCRTYEQRLNPLPRGDNDEVQVEQWPSKTYVRVLIQGATERALPEYYIEMLKNIRHNGEEGFLRMEELLRRYVASEPCPCPIPEFINRKKMKINLRKKRLLALKN